MLKPVATLALGLLFLFGSAQADEKKLANPEAGKCPVSNKDVNPKCTAEVNGKTYAFCCGKCCAKFKEAPEKFIKKDAK